MLDVSDDLSGTFSDMERRSCEAPMHRVCRIPTFQRLLDRLGGDKSSVSVAPTGRGELGNRQNIIFRGSANGHGRHLERQCVGDGSVTSP
jgi:hypothetical protein